MGPVTLSELLVNSDIAIYFGEWCTAFNVHMLQSGQAESVHQGQVDSVGASSACVYTPGGTGAARWAAGNKIICVKIACHAVDDALSAAFGGVVTSHTDLTPMMATTEEPARSWITMMLHLKEQLFRPDSILNQPLVGLPFVDSLVRGLLFATNHRYREDVVNSARHSINNRAT